MNNSYTFNARNPEFFTGCWKTMEIIPVMVAARLGLTYLWNNLLVPGDFYIVGLAIREVWWETGTTRVGNSNMYYISPQDQKLICHVFFLFIGSCQNLASIQYFFPCNSGGPGVHLPKFPLGQSSKNDKPQHQRMSEISWLRTRLVCQTHIHWWRLPREHEE